MLSKDFTMAVIAAPATMLVVATMAGVTAQVTKGDRPSVKRAIYTTSAVLVVASLATSKNSVIVSTVLSVGAVMFIAHPLWIQAPNADS